MITAINPYRAQSRKIKLAQPLCPQAFCGKVEFSSPSRAGEFFDIDGQQDSHLAEELFDLIKNREFSIAAEDAASSRTTNWLRNETQNAEQYRCLGSKNDLSAYIKGMGRDAQYLITDSKTNDVYSFRNMIAHGPVIHRFSGNGEHALIEALKTIALNIRK